MTFNKLRRVDYIVVHCSATKSTADICAGDIKQWHLQRGYLNIGYHYVIRRDGEIQKGRDDDVPGAHVRGYNHCSLGICLVGGCAADGKTAENNFTEAQFTALHGLILHLRKQHGAAEVVGHRDFPRVAKACPSFDVRSWLRQREEERTNEQGKAEEDAEPTGVGTPSSG